jgi:peptide/nickel transport system permease protein
VSLFAFLLIRMAPGSPARLMLPDAATEEQIALMEVKLGLDKPLPVQYWIYMSNVFRGDFGMSITYKQPAGRIIADRLPFTLQLAAGTVLIGCLLSIPLGIIAGSNRGKPIDFFAMLFALLGQSMAPVWLAVLNMFIFSVKLGWLPAIGSGGIKYLILPVLTLGYPMAAGITRVARSGMIDTLSEDYITATYAKGMKRPVVLWKYAFKNAMIPVVTLVGINLGLYLAGSVVTETVFSWTGIGQLLYNSVTNRDYVMVQSLLLISAFMFTIINLIVDIINSWIDPRLSLE